jgi:hypothetical protein
MFALWSTGYASAFSGVSPRTRTLRERLCQSENSRQCKLIRLIFGKLNEMNWTEWPPCSSLSSEVPVLIWLDWYSVTFFDQAFGLLLTFFFMMDQRGCGGSTQLPQETSICNKSLFNKTNLKKIYDSVMGNSEKRDFFQFFNQNWKIFHPFSVKCTSGVSVKGYLNDISKLSLTLHASTFDEIFLISFDKRSFWFAKTKINSRQGA